MINSIDPFLWQLVIVPSIVISAGCLSSWYFRKLWVGPVITLFLNMIFEAWYSLIYFQLESVSFSSWNFFFPFTTFILVTLAYFIFREWKPEDSSS